MAISRRQYEARTELRSFGVERVSNSNEPVSLNNK